MFMKHYGRKLTGIVCLHVDDFVCSGTSSFHAAVTDKIQTKFTFGKKEEESFRFTELDITRENGVVINQNSYVKSLEEIPIADKSDVNKELTVEEYKLFRGAIGKLSWL